MSLRQWWQRLWRRWRRERATVGALQRMAAERAALQAAWQQKRREEQEWHAELAELRARRRGGATASFRTARTSPTAWAAGWTLPATPRTETARQIERIHAQMEAQPTLAGATPSAGADANPRPPAIELVEPPQEAGTELDAWLGHPALTEAAVAWANGHAQAAHQLLSAMEADAQPPALACAAGRLRLDLLRGLSDADGYAQAAAAWAQRFGRPEPMVWASDSLFPPAPMTDPNRATAARVALPEVLVAPLDATLAQLDAACTAWRPDARDQPPLLVIEAGALRRLDFAAAGVLLQWHLAARARGWHVRWDHVPPLVGVLLHAIGIDDVAQVRLRQ